ncbi:MAG: arginase family protein [Candidatus Paceibacterota bacterium]
MITWLPHLSNENIFYSVSKQKDFSDLRLFNNISWLQTNLGIDDPLVKYADGLVQEWKNDIRRIKDAPWIKETIRREMEVNDSSRDADYNECRETINGYLDESNEKYDNPLIFLSDSHTTTEIVLSSYKELNPNPNIGVVCFDAHADLYDSGKIPWKGNVFSILFGNNIISSVLFIGVPKFRQLNIISELPEETVERISFFDFEEGDNGLDSALFKWKALKPTHLFYSFDVDGLDSRKQRYTAMEYCSFHVLTKLAEKDLTHEKSRDVLRKMLRDCIMQPTIDYNNPRNIACKNLFKIGDEGVPLEKVLEAVLAINTYAVKNHIQIGLPLSHGGFVAGDIVELFGPDFEGRTAKAISRIAHLLIEMYRC